MDGKQLNYMKYNYKTGLWKEIGRKEYWLRSFLGLTVGMWESL